MIDAIKNGHDVHAATAAMIFHVDLDELLSGMQEYETLKNTQSDSEQIAALARYSDMRSKGKTINFALTLSAQIKLIELLESPRGQSAAKPSLMEGSETMKAA